MAARKFFPAPDRNRKTPLFTRAWRSRTTRGDNAARFPPPRSSPRLFFPRQTLSFLVFKLRGRAKIAPARLKLEGKRSILTLLLSVHLILSRAHACSPVRFERIWAWKWEGALRALMSVYGRGESIEGRQRWNFRSFFLTVREYRNIGVNCDGLWKASLCAERLFSWILQVEDPFTWNVWCSLIHRNSYEMSILYNLISFCQLSYYRASNIFPWKSSIDILFLSSIFW